MGSRSNGSGDARGPAASLAQTRPGAAVVVVTHTYPFGPGEAFLVPELRELAARGGLLILPVTWNRNLVHPDAAAHVSLVPSIFRQLGWALYATLDLGGLLRLTLALATVCRRSTLCQAIRTLLSGPRALVIAGAVKRSRSGHVHAYWATGPAAVAMAAAWHTGVPWSFTAHRYDIVANEGWSAKTSDARFVRFISRSGAALAGALGLELPSDRERIIHLGVEIPPAPMVKRNGSEVVMVCVARMIPVKGHSTLLDAFADVVRRCGVPVRLELIGDGPLRPDLEEKVDRLGLRGTAIFRGALSHSEVLRGMREGAVDIAVLASHDLGGGLHEGIPVSLMEAMAHGIPVVATDSGGVRELVEGVGELVPAGDTGALADALARLVLDAEARIELGAAGRLRVEEEFDSRATGQAVAEAIRQHSGVEANSTLGDRVVYLSCEDVREGRASDTHVRAIADGLRERGWRVDLLAPRHRGSRSALRRLLAIVALQIRLVGQLKRGDLLYLRSHPLALPAAYLAAARRIPVVQEINGSADDLVDVWPVARRAAGLLRWSMAKQVSMCELAVGVTPQLAGWAESLGAGEVAVIPNGVDPEVFQPNAPSPSMELPPRFVVFVGTLAAWQGLPVLLAAAARPEWPREIHLVVAGDGPLRAEVLKAQTALDNVRALGAVPPREIPGILGRALAAVVPAGGGGRAVAGEDTYELGLSPLKLFEAMSCATPVIAVDQPELGDLVRETHAGMVVPVGQPEGIAAAVAWLAGHPAEGLAMGRRGRAAALASHTWAQRAADTDRLLRQLSVASPRSAAQD